MITNKKQIKFYTKTNESLNNNPSAFLKIKFYNKGKQNKEIFQKIEILKKTNICLKSFVLFYFINSIITIIFSLKSSYTEIIITIQGKGNQNILYSNFSSIPDYIYINNIPQNNYNLSVYIPDNETEVNNVTIK